jgi:diketogulonate reductase-like aldo/keto reductase
MAVLLLHTAAVVAAATAVPTVRLRNGVEMPLVFTGTWRYNDTVVEQMLRLYLSEEIGGAGIDTANDYGNQRGVGRAIASVPDRSAVFVQTKVAGCFSRSAATCAASTAALFQQDLEQLSLPQVDSVMLHFPPLPQHMHPPLPAPAVVHCSEDGGAGSTSPGR